MTSAIRARREAEDGFTLIELLVVVIIIGILAAIAIPAFLNQRENAYYAAAESDVRNAAIEVESFFTRNDAYPADGALPAEVESSAAVTLTFNNPTDNGVYSITAEHDLLTDTSPDATYCSADGGVQADPEAACPTVP